MRIIKEGKPPGERLWTGTCRNCKAEIEARRSELAKIEHDQREGAEFAWAACPCCGSAPRHGYGGVLFYQNKD